MSRGVHGSTVMCMMRVETAVTEVPCSRARRADGPGRLAGSAGGLRPPAPPAPGPEPPRRERLCARMADRLGRGSSADDPCVSAATRAASPCEIFTAVRHLRPPRHPPPRGHRTPPLPDRTPSYSGEWVSSPSTSRTKRREALVAPCALLSSARAGPPPSAAPSPPASRRAAAGLPSARSAARAPGRERGGVRRRVPRARALPVAARP